LSPRLEAMPPLITNTVTAKASILIVPTRRYEPPSATGATVVPPCSIQQAGFVRVPVGEESSVEALCRRPPRVIDASQENWPPKSLVAPKRRFGDVCIAVTTWRDEPRYNVAGKDLEMVAIAPMAYGS
jgi:hypothetical protein